MSFIFCPFYKMMLNDDIKNRILNKIHEMQCHFEWNTFDLHINISDVETTFINIDDIIKQRNIWKNIAKLSIDLWRDFDYYQQFIFKSKCDDDDEYKKRLESLGCICEEGVWRSVSRPSEEVVQTSVFMYCLYEMMIKEKMGDIDTTVDKLPIICIFCDSDIKDFEDICEICGASKEEREELRKNIDNEANKKINNKENNDECKINKDEEERRLIKNKEDWLVVEEYCEVKIKESCLVNVEDKSSQTVVIYKNVSLQTFCNIKNKSSQTLVNINNKKDNDEHLINKVCEDGFNEIKEVKYNYNNILNKVDNQEENQVTFEVDKEVKIKVGKEFEVNNTLKKSADRIWRCTACSLKNSFVNDKCEACGMKNIDLIKRNICDKCGTLKTRDDKDCDICTKNNNKIKIEKNLFITLNSHKNDVNEDEIKIDECSFCFEKIKPKGDCDTCNSSYKDILEYVIKSGSMNRFKGNTNKINNQEDNQDSVEVNEEVNSKMEKEFEEESVNKLLRKLDEDKTWSCTACTMKNSFNNNQCEVCRMKNVRSIKRNTCGDCGTVKNLDNKDCNICTKTTKDGEVKIEKDRWKCEKCGKVHLYSTTVCNGCWGNRIVNGLWMCSACNLINKWKNSKCEVCDAPNIPPLDKNTDNIQKNRGASREFNYSDKSDNLNIKNKWMCMFSNCNGWNMASNSYCAKCKVWRHASPVRGDSVKTLRNGREISVWICNKCSKHNELEKPVCECKESRYKKRFCKGCNIYNDGTSIKCEKCNQ